jgi:hypothetical protein
MASGSILSTSMNVGDVTDVATCSSDFDAAELARTPGK